MFEVRVQVYLIKLAYIRLTHMCLTIEYNFALSFLIPNGCIHSHRRILDF